MTVNPPDVRIQLFDTMTGEKRLLEPVQPGHVGMYVCGLTTYDYTHIGHARTYIAFDVLRRYLEHRGFTVRYVRNYTDVDDRIIRRANELGEDPGALAARFVTAFDEDMAAVGNRPADVGPRVTLEIENIIAMVQKLVELGHAYAVEGDVFFEVSTFPTYGKLSKRKLEDLRAGERIEVDSRKRDPADFALWKAAKPGEPTWESPWGPGRPGWHIECSAMSTRYLGETFDIHGGGRDLVFPHHENEIAQSEACTGKHFVNLWMHAGTLNIEGEKMSKSLNNFWLVRDALKVHHPEVIRFFMLTGHYRKPVNYTVEGLDEARGRVVYFYKTLEAIDRVLAMSPAADPRGKVREERLLDGFWAEVHAAMDDDLNAPRALAALGEVAKAGNELLPKKPKSIGDPIVVRTLARVRDHLVAAGDIFGVFQQAPSDALRQIRDRRVREKGLDEGAIQRLINARVAARAAKDWAQADALRDELQAMGVAVMDGNEGTVWELL